MHKHEWRQSYDYLIKAATHKKKEKAMTWYWSEIISTRDRRSPRLSGFAFEYSLGYELDNSQLGALFAHKWQWTKSCETLKERLTMFNRNSWSFRSYSKLRQGDGITKTTKPETRSQSLHVMIWRNYVE